MQFNFDFLPIKVHPVINFGLENLLIWAYYREGGAVLVLETSFFVGFF